MKNCVSVSEAARIKNVTRQAIYLAIKLNRLKAYKHGDHWRIFTMDLKDYDEKRFSRIYHSATESGPLFDESKGEISADKAGKLLGVPKQKIYYAMRTGKLKCRRKGYAWIIEMNDLLDYQQYLLKNDLTYRMA